VNDVVMPPIGRLLGGVDFKDFFVSLSGQSFPTLAAAKAAGAPTLNYGLFLNTVINFIIVAFAVLLLVQQVNRLFPKPAPAAPAMKECAWCASSIPAAAKRCPHCTSNLSGPEPTHSGSSPICRRASAGGASSYRSPRVWGPQPPAGPAARTAARRRPAARTSAHRR